MEVEKQRIVGRMTSAVNNTLVQGLGLDRKNFTQLLPKASGYMTRNDSKHQAADT